MTAFAVAAAGVGLAAVPTAVVAAAEATDAFAYQVLDCSTPGADFGVALGTPGEPKGPVLDFGLRASVYNGTALVKPAQLQKKAGGPNKYAQWVNVAPDVEYTYVRFDWTDSLGNAMYANTPAPKPEVCDSPDFASGPSTDPGPGLVPVAPVRLFDTRLGRPQRPAAPVAAGQTLRVGVGGVNGVPADATAAMVNVTAANPTAAGFLTVYPCGVPVPKTSSVNFVLAETRAGSAFSKVGSNGEVCVFASVTTDVVVDLNGYVANSSSPTAMTPIRVADTRPGALTDVSSPQKGKTERLYVPVATFGGANVSNVIVNVTAVGADAPGHVVVDGCYKGGIIPDSPPQDASSVLNYVPGRAQANLAIIHPGGFKDLCFYATAPTHLVVDFVGSTSGASPLLGSSSSGRRLLDTRTGQQTSDGKFAGVGRLKANVPLKLKVRDRLNAIGATAVALNVTAAEESAYGHITVYPCGGTVPVASNLNYPPGVAVANLAFTKLDSDGNVCIVSHVDTELVVDLAAMNTTQVQTMDFKSSLYGGWVWSPLTRLNMWSPVAYDDEVALAGADPGYSVTGPSVTGVTAKLTSSGTMAIAVAEGTYVIAQPTYVLSDAAGHTQPVKVSMWIDPQG